MSKKIITLGATALAALTLTEVFQPTYVFANHYQNSELKQDSTKIWFFRKKL